MKKLVALMLVVLLVAMGQPTAAFAVDGGEGGKGETGGTVATTTQVNGTGQEGGPL